MHIFIIYLITVKQTNFSNPLLSKMIANSMTSEAENPQDLPPNSQKTSLQNERSLWSVAIEGT